MRAGSTGSPGILEWYEPLILAVWIGLVTGLIQALGVLFHQRVLGDLITLGPMMWWMTPLTLALLLVPVAAVATILGRWWPGIFRSRSVLLALLLTPGIFNGLPFFIPTMGSGARLLFAVGIALVITRIAERFPVSSRRIIARTLLPVVGAVTLAFLATQLAQPIWERWKIHTLARAPSHAPNILLLVLDTVRGANLSVNGYGQPTTPFLERYAKGGVRFANAISTAPWTLPSHASMFTGHWPDELSADWERALDGSAPTLAEVLSAHGYVTAGFVANLAYVSRVHGLSRGFVHYEDFRATAPDFLVSAKLPRDVANLGRVRRLVSYYAILGEKKAPGVVNEVLRWLSARKAHRPWFVFANFIDAHEPCIPPESLEERLGSPEVLKVRRKLGHLTHLLYHALLENKASVLSPAGVERERLAYDACLAYLDQNLQRLLDSLATLRLDSNTVVMIVADHGEQFGEHGHFVHGNSLYRQLIQVPFLLVAPGRVPTGVVVTDPVSLRDLPATILDLAGINQGPIPGSSLSGCWTADGCSGSQVISELVLPEGQRSYSIIEGGLHYINWRDQKNSGELLYAWPDSEETQDLAKEPGWQSAVSRFRADSTDAGNSLAVWQSRGSLPSESLER